VITWEILNHYIWTVRYSTYDFLLPFHSIYCPILYHFPHTARHWLKIANNKAALKVGDDMSEFCKDV